MEDISNHQNQVELYIDQIVQAVIQVIEVLLEKYIIVTLEKLVFIRVVLITVKAHVVVKKQVMDIKFILVNVMQKLLILVQMVEQEVELLVM